MMKFNTYYTSRAKKLIDQIKRNEELETISYTIKNTALGDTVIAVSGDREDVKTLKEIFNMVY